MPARSPYSGLIESLDLGEDVRHVEAYMRLEYGTLDHLDRDRFDALAKECAAAAALDRDEAEALARSMGFAPAYLDLVAQLHRAQDVEARARTRMLATQPGSEEGARWARLRRAAEQKAADLHRQVRQHPDAPPAG